jgi:signal transduction histidine kinase
VRLEFGLYGVAVLHEDRQGVLWVGTRRDGLHALINGQLQRIPAVHHRVNAIEEDAEGNLWVGTEGEGLFRLRRRVFLTVGVREGLPIDRVLSVDEGWVVPQEGGLVRLTPPGPAELVPGMERFSLASVLADGEGGAWLGAVNGRLLRLNRDGQLTRFPFRFSVPDPQLRVLFQDRRGNLWIGGYPFGLFRLPAGVTSYFENFTERGLPQNPVTALAEDRNGRLWVGTGDGKLHRLDGERFTSFGPEHGLPGAAIGTLRVTGAGALWIGTLGGGLGRFRDGRARFANVEHGLHDNVITQMVEDDHGFAWIGSSRGIFRVRLAELEKFADGGRAAVESIPHGRSDGLVHVECIGGYQPSACKTKSGRLWFGTSKGVILADPASLSFNDRPPALVLEQVEVDGAALTNLARAELPHDYRKLELRYTALSFCAPERVRFRRQVAGFDHDWVEDKDSRSTSYPRLPPGQYTFRFTACNNDGVWNETPVAFAFTVKPAFWQTWWFRLTALTFFALAVSLAARYAATVRMRRRLQRLEQAHAVERERARIARDLHDDLGARLTRMSYQTDLAAAELGEHSPQAGDLRGVADQARQATRALDEAVWLIHPGKDSLRHLVDYIGQYANEFFRHSSIHCRRDLPRELPEWPLPAEWRHHLFLAVKEALNNAHKHSGAAEIWIRVRFEPPDLQILIEDNGRGIATAAPDGTGNGLANLRQRLAGLGGEALVTSESGRGTHVRLSVRLPAPAGGGLNLREESG